MLTESKSSHKQILKSSGVVGGSQIIVIINGIIRTKVIAILLGPLGVGYLGILQSTMDLVRNATGFGINFSGVKEIAEANASQEHGRINKAIYVVRRWALWTGILGMLITIILCIPLSNYSFGSQAYAIWIAIASSTLLISSISAGQLALLQGLRKIKLLAQASVFGAIAGTVFTLPLYMLFGNNGIVPGMVLTALVSLVISWIYVKDVKVETEKLSAKEILVKGWGMARLGFFIVLSGFIATATMYVVRVYIASKLDLNAVGAFQASWMISKTYIGIILYAMLADFFPRLSAINHDNAASNKLINEQLEMTLIIGIPMVVGLSAFAGLMINILYSSSFTASVQLLQWQMGGTFLTLILWPLGVMFLAKGKGLYSFINDTGWSVMFLGCMYFGWNYWGFNTLGIASLLASGTNLLTVLISVRHLGKFSFSKVNIYYIIYGFATTILILFIVFTFSGIKQYLFSTVLLIFTLVFSTYRLNKIVDLKNLIQGVCFRSKNK